MGGRIDDCDEEGAQELRGRELETFLRIALHSNPKFEAQRSGALKAHRLSARKLLYSISTALFVFLTLSFLSYRSVASSGWPVYSVGLLNHEDQGIAIKLHPDLHSHRRPRVTSYDWTITSDVRSPDGVEKLVYLINGQFPGPTVEAMSGDRLVFKVHNNLTDGEGLAMHWHGLFMRGANDMDGALGLTQSAIPQGDSMTYEYEIAQNQCGTFWYHAHSQLQRADGLYGGLVIHCPADRTGALQDVPRHENDVLLLIGDWYHRPAQQVLDWYHHYRSFGNEPVPDSLVINDGGSYNCSMAVPARPVSCEPTAPPVLFSVHERATRLRVVNVGSLAGFTLNTQGATMRPFELDGGNRIESTDASSVGILYPGERVDLVISALDGADSSSLEIVMDPENLRYGNPALTRNQTFPILMPQSKLVPEAPQSTASTVKFTLPLDLQRVGSISAPTLPPPDQTFVVYATTMLLAHLENRPTGFINHTSWVPSSSPDSAALASLEHDQWPDTILVPQVKSGEWVDVVINNLDDGGHPFHLHGHAFHVLRTHKAHVGYGSYNPLDASHVLPADDPEWDARPRVKDTVFVPAKGHVVIRLQAQAGLWAFHCHVIWHQATGMAMALEVVQT